MEKGNVCPKFPHHRTCASCWLIPIPNKEFNITNKTLEQIHTHVHTHFHNQNNMKRHLTQSWSRIELKQIEADIKTIFCIKMLMYNVLLLCVRFLFFLLLHWQWERPCDYWARWDCSSCVCVCNKMLRKQKCK